MSGSSRNNPNGLVFGVSSNLSAANSLNSGSSVVVENFLALRSNDTTPSTSAAYGILCSQNGNLIFIDTSGKEINISSNFSLPAALESIANLTTTGNEMIYTIGADQYATTMVSSLGRTFILQNTQNAQQSVLGVVVGSDVLEYSNVLQSIIDLANAAPIDTDRFLYTSSINTFSSAVITSFARSLLTQSTVTGMRNLLSVIERPSTATAQSLARWVNTSLLDDSVVTLDDLGNLNNISNLSALTIDNGNASIDIQGTTIANVIFQYLSTLNQNIAQSDNVTFNSVLVTQAVTGASAGNILTTKTYVDNVVAGAGSPPLQSADYETKGVVLPNAPSYAAEVLTSTAGAGTQLQLAGGLFPAVSDRILVESQADNRENGVYFVVDDGAGANPWSIQRTSDFNQAAMPVPSGTLIFISESQSTYSLVNTVNTVDPLTDAVVWTIISQGSSLTAGQGIDAADLGAGTISVDASSLFKNAPLAYSQGGTGSSSFATASRLVQTNGGNTALITSTLDPSTVTTATNTQTFQNKTFTPAVTGNVLTLEGIPFATGGTVLDGSHLAINAGVCQWLPFTSINQGGSQILYVDQGGLGDFTTIKDAVDAANTGVGLPARVTGPVSSTTPITIVISPGVYTENNPINLNPFLSVAGKEAPLSTTVLPINDAVNVFSMNYSTTLKNMQIIGNANNIGINVSWTVRGQLSRVFDCVVRDCAICYRVQGNASPINSGCLFQNCTCYRTPVTGNNISYGFYVDNAGVCQLNNVACFSFVIGDFDVSYYAVNPASRMLLFSSYNTGPDRGVFIDDGARCELFDITINNYADVALELGTNGCDMSIYSAKALDNSATAGYENQLTLRTNGGSNVQFIGLEGRVDRVIIQPDTELSGLATSLVPGERQTINVGEFVVGIPFKGSESAFGEGDSYVGGMVVKTFDGVAYNDITTTVNVLAGSTAAFPTNTVGDILYIGGTLSTIFGGVPDILFPGIKLTVDTAATPQGSLVLPATEPPTYHCAVEYYDGTTWRDVRYMTTNADAPYKTFRRDIFFAGAAQIRWSYLLKTNKFNPLPYSIGTYSYVSSNTYAENYYNPSTFMSWPQWTTTTIDGTQAYWIRIRLVQPYTVVPTISLIKLHSNRLEINSSGETEAFGKAQNIQILPVSLRDFYRLDYNLAKASSIAYSQILAMRSTDNVFDNTGGGIITNFDIPNDMDTGMPMIVKFKYVRDSTNAGAITFRVRYGYSVDYIFDSSNVSTVSAGGGTVPVAQTAKEFVFTHDEAQTIANKQITAEFQISCEDTLNNRRNYTANLIDPRPDLLWLSIERPGGDAYGNAKVVIANVSMYYIKWNNGNFWYQ